MAKRTMQEIEALLGAPPRRGEGDVYAISQTLALNPEKRALLNEWAVLNGIPHKSASTAYADSIAKAYCLPRYLSSWRMRVNPKWGVMEETVLDGLDELEEEKPLEATKQGLNRDLATGLATGSLIDAVMAKVLPVVDEKLSKVELSPQARQKVLDLATAAANAAVERLMPPQRIEIHNASSGAVVDLGLQHEKFEILLKACQALDHRGNRLNVWLSGPTGSGKTTAAENISRALGLDFACDGSLDADYKLIGFRDAAGNVAHTQFRRVFVNGGVYVADEVDNWNASALLSLNSALASGFCAFPDKLERRHKDCIIIACANTWGLGATSDYVGRSRLDAASLDRFHPKIDWPIDEKLEAAVAQQMWGESGITWHNIVLQFRQRVKSQGLKVIISPRATFTGIAQLQAGFSTEEVMKMTLLAGLSPEQIKGLTSSLDTASGIDDDDAASTTHFRSQRRFT